MRIDVDVSDFGEYLHYGMPLTLVTTTGEDGRVNVATNASITPLPGSTPRLVIGVLKENLTNRFIADSGEFVVNLLTPEMRGIAKQCGHQSGVHVDKLALSGLTPEPAVHIKPPLLKECPLIIECRVQAVHHLEDLDLWVADILRMSVHREWSDGRAGVNLQEFQPLLYAFGHTFECGPQVGVGSI